VKRILVVNPNTTQAVTDRIAVVGRTAASADTTLDFVTAPFGPAVISSRAEDALAGHGALEAVATHYDGHDAVILGASWDTALAGLRELMPVPVVGFTEAAITVATQIAERFALVTVGPRAASGHRRNRRDRHRLRRHPRRSASRGAGGGGGCAYGRRTRRRRGDHSDRCGVRRPASRH
jgi:Asp/Glu/hydantoin racemase